MTTPKRVSELLPRIWNLHLCRPRPVSVTKTHRFVPTRSNIVDNANQARMHPTVLRQLRSLSNLFNTTNSNNSSTSPKKQLTDSSYYSSHYATAAATAVESSPSFRVAQVSYDGKVELLQLKTEEIVRLPSVYARDLLYLNLTSHQEHIRGGGVGGISGSTVRREMPAAISPREESIIFSFANIRAVVTRQNVVLFDAHRPSVQEFANELAMKFRVEILRANNSNDGSSNVNAEENDQLPLELVFLEEVLEDAIEAFNGRLRLFNPIVDSLLDRADDEIYSETGVHLLVPLKDSLQSFEMAVKQSLECLKELLEDDEAMLDLLLTEHAEASKAGTEVDHSRHEHVELLLGVYAQQLSNTLLEIKFLLQRLQSKQEFVAIALAGYRNRLVTLNVRIAVATLSLGLATTVAGFFGMNLLHGLEDSPTAFNTVIVSTSVVSASVTLGFMRFLSGKSVQARASQRLEEIETLNGALSDLSALDFVIKDAMATQNKEDNFTLDKEEFRKKLIQARHSGTATDKEVDLLFNVLDAVGDGKLKGDDFSLLKLSGRRRRGLRNNRLLFGKDRKRNRSSSSGGPTIVD